VGLALELVTEHILRDTPCHTVLDDPEGHS
jgi:hypothetical protein